MPKTGVLSVAAHNHTSTGKKPQKNHNGVWFCLFLIVSLIFASACTAERGRLGPAGTNGTPGAVGPAGTGNMTPNLTANMTAGPAPDLNNYYLNDTSKALTGGMMHRDTDAASLYLMGGPLGGGKGASVGVHGSDDGSAGLFVVNVPNAAKAAAVEVLRVAGVTDIPFLNMNAHQIKAMADPTANQDAVTLAYYNAHLPGAGVTDHHFLTNLTVDDHTQYANLSGRAGGQVLIGGRAGGDKLYLYGSSGGTYAGGSAIILGTDNQERVGIGTPTPSYGIDVFKEGAGPSTVRWVSNSSVITQDMYSYQNTSTSSNVINFNGGRGKSVAPAVVSNEDRLGSLRFLGYSGAAANHLAAARIQVNVDGEPDTAGDTSDMPGSITFLTTPNGAGTPVERLRIDNQGNVSVSTTQTFAKFQVNGTLMFPSFPSCTLSTDVNGVVYCVSDEKMKDNIVPFNRGLESVLKVNPITYNFKIGSGLDTVNKHSDFSAQNLKIAIPESVYEKGDTYSVFTTDPKTEETIETIYPVLDKDGKQTSKLYVDVKPIITTLINSIKEQQLIIEAQQEQINKLNERITALEKKVGI